ncbi:MAG: helix-turn-helix transcriptional regulator [Anaerolineales bacterium]|nr:helix-turn-helix transcriptional regulator [Anaerolineales bacterium]
MNRFEFGRLVASLREDMRWTQFELAEKSGVDISAISNIERGERRTLLKDNMLVKLADGFHLTSMERMEFLFAASGVTETEKVRNEDVPAKKRFNAKAFIEETGRRIARIAMPAFVTDAFCDILAVNHCVIEFYNVPKELMQNGNSVIGGYNEMSYVFQANSNFPDIIGNDSLERLALINVRYFRRRTLRVRCKPYFSILLNEFFDNKKYPAFERCWRRILFEDIDDFALPIHRSPETVSAHSFVSTETLFALTPYGEIYLHQLVPLNRKTAERMAKISKKVGEGYELLAAFPDKRKL